MSVGRGSGALPGDSERRARGSVFRGASLTLLALILTGAMRIVARVGAESWFGIETLGMVTIAMSVATIVTIIGPGGLAPGTTKFISQLRGEGQDEPAHRMAAVSARLGVSLTLVGGVVAVVYVASNPAVTESGGTGAVVATGLITLAFGMYLAGKAIAYGFETVRRYLMLEIVGVALFATVVVAAVVLGSGTAIIVALAAGYVPVGVLALRDIRRSIGSRADLPIREFLGYGVVGAVGSLAGIGFTYATPLAASYIDGVVGAALIGAALTILEPLFLAPRAIGLVLLPHLSFTGAADEVIAGGASLRVSTGLVALISSPAIVVVILESDRLLQWVFSDELEGAATLALLAAAFFVSIVGAPSITALAAIRLKEASLAMWSSLVGFGVALIIWIGFAPSLGVAVIGLGYLVGSTIQVAVPLRVATTRYRPRWGSFWYRLGALVVVVGALSLRPPSFHLDAIGVGASAILLLPELRTLMVLGSRAFGRPRS